MTRSPNTLFQRWPLRWAWLLGVLLCSAHASRAAEPAVAAPGPQPVADFFATPAMGAPVLSPNGKYLALEVADAEGRHRLAVLSLEDRKDLRIVASFYDGDVQDVHWVNDERLVFSVADLGTAQAERRATGLFAVNRDGQFLRRLVQRSWRAAFSTGSHIVSRELRANHVLQRVLRDGSADIIVLRHDYDSHWRELLGTTPLRLDTLTGVATRIDHGAPGGARSCLLDALGQPHVVESQQGDQTQTHWRQGGVGDWRQVATRHTYRSAPGAFSLFALGPKGEVYVSAARNDAAVTSALYLLDPTSGRPEARPLIALSGFNFSGRLVFDAATQSLAGVHYLSDGPGSQWFDADLRALQERVDQHLRGVNNRLHVAECGCSRWVVVASSSDRQPPVYTLYDRVAERYEPIGQAHPQIDPQRMAERDFQRIRARDGLNLPVHVTRPSGKGPWPMVVLVHGGPYLRGGHWQWTPESQFLASRGYLVVEPEFRGSTGYGWRHFRAGWKQWGLKMQDDIADAARWAVAQGLGDASRICIAGASYGGYAALMGLLNDPQLYRCGVALAAVTDIAAKYEMHWSDLPETWIQYGMPSLIGSPKADGEQLRATSPLQQAARLTQPLLLAHGTQDRRVPFEHATRLREALQGHNKQLEWLVYGEEGHRLAKPANRIDYWTRVEQFLAKHLAKPGPQ